MKSKITRGWQQWQRDDSPVAVPELIEPGLEVTADAVWSWVEIPAAASHLMEDDEVSSATLEVAAALHKLVPAEAEYHLKVMWAEESEQDYFDSWAHDPSVTAPNFREYVELGAHRIRLNAEAGVLRRRIVLLGVRWQTTEPAAPTTALRRQLRSHGAQRRDARARLDAVRDKIGNWFTQMRRSELRAVPAPAGLIAWAYARELRRGSLAIPQESELSGGKVINLLHGEVDPTEDPNYVVVRDARTGQRRYVAIVVASVNGFSAEHLHVPGGEWLEMISELPGVEASLRGTHHGQQGSLALLKDGQRTVQGQRREANDHGVSLPPEMEGTESILADRHREVAGRTEVEATNHPRWVVEADSPEELHQRVEDVRALYGGLIDLVVVPHVQDLLWRELLPGDAVRVGEFAQIQPMRTLAGSWFHGGSNVGDDSGPYLGLVEGSTPRPLRLHLNSHEFAGQTTTITATGKSGAGKSTAVELLTLSTLATGSWSALVDAKGDLGGIRQVASNVLGVPVQSVNVAAPEASGVMDPMRFAANDDEARTLTLGALVSALGGDDRRRAESVIERAIEAVLQRPREAWSCQAVMAELLATSDEAPAAALAHEIGETLANRARLPQLRPVLGDLGAGHTALQIGRGLVYFDLSGLDMPLTRDADQWEPAQRASVVTWRMVMAYAMSQTRGLREVPKWLAITELHLLTGTPEGRNFVSYIARAGRALRLGQLLDSQAARDLADISGLVEQIVISLAFRADGETEQQAQAELLHRPQLGDRLHTALAGLRVGEAVIRDRDNHLGIVSFDLLTSEIAEALNTNAAADDGTVAVYETVEHAEIPEEVSA